MERVIGFCLCWAVVLVTNRGEESDIREVLCLGLWWGLGWCVDEPQAG